MSGVGFYHLDMLVDRGEGPEKRMKLLTMLVAILTGFLPADAATPPEPATLMREAFTNQDGFFLQARDYTYLRHQETRRLDSQGRVTSTSSTDHEITILYGEPYHKLICKDSRLLSADEARKEQKKLDNELASRAANQDRRRREAEREREEQRKALAEVAEAFDWKLEAEEAIGGRPMWMMRATPRRGYRPRSRQAKVFTKMSGRLWIDQADRRMAKVEATVDDTISFGLFLLRIQPGFRFTFEMARMETSAWLPKEGWLKGEARLGGLKTIRLEMENRYSGYQRFQSESHIISSGPAKD